MESRMLELGYRVERDPTIAIGRQTMKPDLIGRCGRTIIVCDVQVKGDQADLDLAHLDQQILGRERTEVQEQTKHKPRNDLRGGKEA